MVCYWQCCDKLTVEETKALVKTSLAEHEKTAHKGQSKGSWSSDNLGCGCKSCWAIKQRLDSDTLALHGISVVVFWPNSP